MKAEAHITQEALNPRGAPPAATLASWRREIIVMAFALTAAWCVWNQAPVGGMDVRGMHFLATLVVAIALWVLDFAEEYIVGLWLLLAWAVLGIAPAKVVLAGFSEDSWFFTVGALGIGVAIAQTSLLRRASLRLLRWVPIRYYKTHTVLLLGAGLFSGPLLPTGKARAAVAAPLTQSISQAAGFRQQSNGSAAIALSGFMGFTQMSFVFLTGASQCLLAWSLLPQPAKAEFGWLTWFIAALPAGALITVFMALSIHALLPLSAAERRALAARGLQEDCEMSGTVPASEWLALAALLATLAGWITAPLHGINETWIALGGLLLLVLVGALDTEHLRRKLDWGLVLFIGVLNSMGALAAYLNIDRWLIDLAKSSLAQFQTGPYLFLTALFVLISATRFLLRKTACATIFPVVLAPLSVSVGIHPGVMIVAAAMIAECFILNYQDGPFQIAQASDGAPPFTNAQARKILAAKYLATFLAIIVSVPYWQWIGFVR